MFLSIYIYIFVPIVSLFAFLGVYKINNKKSFEILTLIFVLLSISIILTTRDVNAPNDMANYSWMYDKAKDYNYIFTAYHGNMFYTFLTYLGNFFGLSKEIFFKVLSIIYLFIFTYGLKLIFQNIKYLILSIVFFSLSSTFILLFTNVIRQGLALSLFVLAIGLLSNNKKTFAYIILLLSIFSHFSMLPISLIILFVFYFHKKYPDKKFIYLLLLLPVIGKILFNSLASIGGLFHKIESLSNHAYNNNIVYVKMLILYIFLHIIYIYGKKFNLFHLFSFRFIYNIYFYLLSLILLTSPVLLLSSRFLYYTSALIPILLAYIFYSKRNFLNIYSRYIVFLIITIFYGIFVYNYKSTASVLGI